MLAWLETGQLPAGAVADQLAVHSQEDAWAREVAASPDQHRLAGFHLMDRLEPDRHHRARLLARGQKVGLADDRSVGLQHLAGLAYQVVVQLPARPCMHEVVAVIPAHQLDPRIAGGQALIQLAHLVHRKVGAGSRTQGGLMAGRVLSDGDGLASRELAIDRVEQVGGVDRFPRAGGVIVQKQHAVEIHAHPVDSVVARVVLLQAGHRHAVGTPDQGRPGSLAKSLVDGSKGPPIGRRITVIRGPLSVHLAREANEDRPVESGHLGHEALQVGIILHLVQAARLPGDLGDGSAGFHLLRPLERKGLTIRTVHKEAGMILAGQLVETRDIAMPLTLQHDRRQIVVAVDEGSEVASAGGLEARPGLPCRRPLLQVKLDLGGVTSRFQLLGPGRMGVAGPPVDVGFLAVGLAGQSEMLGLDGCVGQLAPVVSCVGGPGGRLEADQTLRQGLIQPVGAGQLERLDGARGREGVGARLRPDAERVVAGRPGRRAEGLGRSR